jgi:hypothetical protein
MPTPPPPSVAAPQYNNRQFGPQRFGLDPNYPGSGLPQDW